MLNHPYCKLKPPEDSKIMMETYKPQVASESRYIECQVFDKTRVTLLENFRTAKFCAMQRNQAIVNYIQEL